MSQQTKASIIKSLPRSIQPLKEFKFDITEASLPKLSDDIVKCVALDIKLQIYSSLTFLNPGISMTEIPGFKELFTKACLEHGLFGYLEWLKKKDSKYADIVMNNVIIITCGRKAPGNSDEKGIVHEIDQDALASIRKQSQARFDQMIENL